MCSMGCLSNLNDLKQLAVDRKSLSMSFASCSFRRCLNLFTPVMFLCVQQEVVSGPANLVVTRKTHHSQWSCVKTTTASAFSRTRRWFIQHAEHREDDSTRAFVPSRMFYERLEISFHFSSTALSRTSVTLLFTTRLSKHNLYNEHNEGIHISS